MGSPPLSKQKHRLQIVDSLPREFSLFRSRVITLACSFFFRPIRDCRREERGNNKRDNREEVTKISESESNEKKEREKESEKREREKGKELKKKKSHEKSS